MSVKLIHCWRCGWRQLEYYGLKNYLSNRGKCFRCRLDTIDHAYGIAMLAEIHKQLGNGTQTRPSRWQGWVA